MRFCFTTKALRNCGMNVSWQHVVGKESEKCPWKQKEWTQLYTCKVFRAHFCVYLCSFVQIWRGFTGPEDYPDERNMKIWAAPECAFRGEETKEGTFVITSKTSTLVVYKYAGIPQWKAGPLAHLCLPPENMWSFFVSDLVGATLSCKQPRNQLTAEWAGL